MAKAKANGKSGSVQLTGKVFFEAPMQGKAPVREAVTRAIEMARTRKPVRSTE